MMTSIVAMRFAKGHGTGNDFVIVPDLDGQLDLTADLVARLCDRHFGIGADGVLRIVPAAAAAEAAGQEATWFMDYRNADGSIAEMCGNGVRVFARYLLEHGLATGSEVPIATRAGLRLVRADRGGGFTAEMGPATVLGTGRVQLGGREIPGLAISVGNPHVACVTSEPVTAADLSAPRVLSPVRWAAGANVEIVQITGEHEADMRVHERGSGITLSCGTGTVAAAVAAAVAAGEWPATSGRRWTVRVPGGTLTVVPGPDVSLLSGPAEIVAEGEIAADWLARTGGSHDHGGVTAVGATVTPP